MGFEAGACDANVAAVPEVALAIISVIIVLMMFLPLCRMCQPPPYKKKNAVN